MEYTQHQPETTKNPLLVYTEYSARSRLMDITIDGGPDNWEGHAAEMMIVDTPPIDGDTEREEIMEVDAVPTNGNDQFDNVQRGDPLVDLSLRMANLSIFWEHDYDHVHDLAVRLADLTITDDDVIPIDQSRYANGTPDICYDPNILFH